MKTYFGILAIAGYQILNPAWAFSGESLEGDPIVVTTDTSRNTTYFFLNYDDCMDRLTLPDVNPQGYCRQRFPVAISKAKLP